MFEYLLATIGDSGKGKSQQEQTKVKTYIKESAAHVECKSGKRPKWYFQLAAEGKYFNDSNPIKPQRLMWGLTQLFPSNTRFLADTGNSLVWAIHYLHPFDRRMRGTRDNGSALFQGCLEFSSMGWAIGASIGAALGSPKNPVVCITGDGSWLMSGQELTVAIQEQLPITFVILNDGALGMVKHGQRLAGAEAVGFELPAIDYCAVAKAMGAKGHIIHSSQDLHVLDSNAICTRPGPTVLDVHIDPEEVPPMAVRMKVLGGEV